MVFSLVIYFIIINEPPHIVIFAAIIYRSYILLLSLINLRYHIAIYSVLIYHYHQSTCPPALPYIVEIDHINILWRYFVGIYCGDIL
jgi:hypothetical protein